MAVIIGAALHYIFTLRTESSKQYLNLKSQAYLDFINSVSGIEIAQRRQDQEKEVDYLILLTNAKIRIAVYGSRDIVKWVAEFFRKHGTFKSAEASRSFIDIVQKMRSETTDKNETAVDDRDISQLLFSHD